MSSDRLRKDRDLIKLILICDDVIAATRNRQQAYVGHTIFVPSTTIINNSIKESKGERK